MKLMIYNTLTRKKEVFIPLSSNEVKMYVCGITPYDSCHIGHARCYVTFDVIRRYLQYLGYKVTYVQNFTDIDDKIIDRANATKISPFKLAQQYEEEYFVCMDALGIMRADNYPKVTEHISEIINVVSELIDKGYAYVVDGNVYFEVSRFEEYGKLSGRRIEDLLTGVRIEVDDRKRHPADFALWKAAKPDEPAWDSPWGMGRPGWHIECSVMSQKYLGETFDIHGGGLDLIFPHHENEIAQAECYTGKRFANYWIHNGFVTVNKEKMSKSLGNFFILKDALKEYSPEAIRLFLLTTHYKAPVDFSVDKLTQAQATMERCYNLTDNIAEFIPIEECVEIEHQDYTEYLNQIRSIHNEAYVCAENILNIRERFIAVMNDDFNFPEALAVIHELISHTNKLISFININSQLSDAGRIFLKYTFALFSQLMNVLGLPVKREDRYRSAISETEVLVDKLIQILIDIRHSARDRKDWNTADTIRSRLKDLNIILEDTPKGTRYKMNLKSASR
jgi:cysteinyl-tRNA synthetase